MQEEKSYKGLTGTHVQKGVPLGYTAITPFIVVSNPEGAIAFYKSVFNASLQDVTTFMDATNNPVIVHAELDFGNGRLQLGAANADFHLTAPSEVESACYSLGLYVPDVDQVLHEALKRGAALREPVTNFVSGDRFCSLIDPYGVRWTIMSRIDDISEAESFRRVKEWATGRGVGKE